MIETIIVSHTRKVPYGFTGCVLLNAYSLSAVLYVKEWGVEEEGEHRQFAHRLDGPAKIWINENKVSYAKEYWIDGRIYSQDNWFQKLTEGQKIIALMNPENFAKEIKYDL